MTRGVRVRLSKEGSREWKTRGALLRNAETKPRFVSNGWVSCQQGRSGLESAFLTATEGLFRFTPGCFVSFQRFVAKPTRGASRQRPLPGHRSTIWRDAE